MCKSLQWEDWFGVALGAWLLVSPWVLGYPTDAAATMNALFVGTTLVLEELLDLVEHEAIEEWIDLAAGAWLVISPLALDFTSTPAAVNAVAVGALTIAFALTAVSPAHARIEVWWHEHGFGR